MENIDISNKPDNFLVWAILTTIACCLPLGIVAIVYANKVDSLWFAGQKNASIDAAQKARMWTFISLGFGCISYFFAFVIGLLSAFSS